jgi:hypothetical protein
MNSGGYDAEMVEELARDCMAYVLQHGPEREVQFNNWLARVLVAVLGVSPPRARDGALGSPG